MRFLGANYVLDGPEPEVPQEVVKQHLQLLKNMNGNSVRVVGAEPERVKAVAEAAIKLGLGVWIVPSLRNKTPAQYIKALEPFVLLVKELKKSSPSANIVFCVGNELTLECRGLIKGKTYEERSKALSAYLKIVLAPEEELKLFPRVMRAADSYSKSLEQKINRLLIILARKARTARVPLTYSNAPWEKVRWEKFDIASTNLYLSHWNRGRFGDVLRRMKAAGKPTILSQFGTASFKGAIEQGAFASQFLLEHPNTQYDEDTQIVGLSEQLKGIGAAELQGCFVWNLLEKDDRGFGILRVVKDGRAEPKRTAGIVSEFFSNWSSASRAPGSAQSEKAPPSFKGFSYH